MKPIILVFIFLMVSMGSASAEIYKCKDAKNRTIYSQTPCSSNNTQTLTDIPDEAAPSSPSNSHYSQQPNTVVSNPPMIRSLDAAVKSAIAQGDIPHAEEIAVTAQQWEWITAAKKDNQKQPVIGRTEADLRSERSGSLECQQAKRSYDIASGTNQWSQIEARKNEMYEACGMSVPNEYNNINNTTVNGRPNINGR